MAARQTMHQQGRSDMHKAQVQHGFRCGAHLLDH